MSDHTRRWYDSHAHRYDRDNPGLPGDLAFYTALATGARVLEIGGGTGRVTAALAAVAARVVAVDLSAAMLARAVLRLGGMTNVALVRADARRLPLTGQFELIALPYRVIHHLAAEERRSLWSTTVALLAPGGQLAFDSWHGPTGVGGPPMASIHEAALASELECAGLRVTRVTNGFTAGTDVSTFVRVWTAARRD